MKRIVISLLTLAALASCTKLELEGGRAPGSEIRLTAEVDGTRTRACANKATGLAGASFIVKEGADPTNNFSGGTSYTGNVAATTGKVTFSSAPVYNTSDQNAYMVAYYPGGPLTSDAIGWDIDGTTDIMVTNTLWNAGKYTAPVTTGLNFNHQLARIEVVMKAEQNADIAAVRKAWGTIRKIEFVNAPRKMKYDLSGKPTVTTSDPADFALLANYDGGAFLEMTVPETTNTAVNAVAMLAPVANTATESFKLKVTATGISTTPVQVEIPVSLDGTIAPMTAGYTHTVELIFKAASQIVEVRTSTIDTWEGGNTGGNDMVVHIQTIVVDGAEFSVITEGLFYGATYTVPPPTTTSYNTKPKGSYYYSMTDALVGEPPYSRFEASTINVTASIQYAPWQTAVDACAAKIPTGEWRLPRISELMLIYLNKTALGLNFGGTNYWSATENSISRSWYMDLSNGYIGDYSQNSPGAPFRACCVREIK